MPENSSYDSVKNFLCSSQLPSHDVLFELTEAVSTLLEEELTVYRPADSRGMPGGLLDFRTSFTQTAVPLPVIVLPDLHARPLFLLNVLDYTLPSDFTGEDSITVFEALQKNLVNVICVGDALHSEYQTRERWHAINAEFEADISTGPAMTAEMHDGLCLVCAILKLKLLFPENFHFLKGNHENILNKTGGGDYSFYKFADESYMCCQFIQDYYGDDIVHLLSCVEDFLPLIAVTDNIVVSHAEPYCEFSREELINARCDDGQVIECLTWTQNDSAQQGSVQAIIKNLCGNDEGYTYLAGHRPVVGNYRKWYGELFIQIHNPAKQNIALVYKDKKFNPESDIVSVIKNNDDIENSEYI